MRRFLPAPPPRRAAPLAVALVLTADLWPAVAGAVGLDLRSETSPYPGVTVRRYRTRSPSTDAWLVLTDLCHEGVRIQATGPTTSYQATGDFAGVAEVQVATNGDFFKADPFRVYGDVVGDALHWPAANTGRDPAYANEWYYQRYGWIAFGADWVDFSHTKSTKLHDDAAVEGFSPGAVTTAVPPGAIALLSGFPELVVEGRTYTCVAPDDGGCFPDRSDMRARHPRTAMGLTQDRRTFMLLVVDGRTADSAGMYGAELAETMGRLGAYEAFNLDGGGSSQLWVAGDGYLNNRVGNNNGSGTRAVADHWGVRVAAGLRASSCPDAPPCGTLPPEGGIIDDDGACFEMFGPSRWWRREAAGHGGHLHWTNSSASTVGMNSAWWRVDLAEAGRYRVEFKGSAAFGLFTRTHYDVLADGQIHTERVAQGASDDWQVLGEYDFAAGGRQHVHVIDDGGANPPGDRKIVADAIRLVRVDAPPDAGVAPDAAAEPPPQADASAAGGPDAAAGELDGLPPPPAGDDAGSPSPADMADGADGADSAGLPDPDDGVPPPDARAARDDAARTPGDDAGVGPAPARDDTASAASDTAVQMDGGCACRSVPRSPGGAAWPLTAWATWASLARLGVRRRRRS